ncbi:hypothetical protein EDC04DRAFT_3095986 [Pisolithus marmoratus]|nr:hypothetical protein EDC04DRAFT_3095986 [Pisolithus marmoratus]
MPGRLRLYRNVDVDVASLWKELVERLLGPKVEQRSAMESLYEAGILCKWYSGIVLAPGGRNAHIGSEMVPTMLTEMGSSTGNLPKGITADRKNSTEHMKIYHVGTAVKDPGSNGNLMMNDTSSIRNCKFQSFKCQPQDGSIDTGDLQASMGETGCSSGGPLLSAVAVMVGKAADALEIVIMHGIWKNGIALEIARDYVWPLCGAVMDSVVKTDDRLSDYEVTSNSTNDIGTGVSDSRMPKPEIKQAFLH